MISRGPFRDPLKTETAVWMIPSDKLQCASVIPHVQSSPDFLFKRCKIS